MPKTLKALPSSQYPTLLELVFGNDLLPAASAASCCCAACAAVSCASFPRVALDWAAGLDVPKFRNRATLRMGEAIVAVRGACRRHWLQTSSLEDALRAILPSPGTAEAIVRWREPVVGDGLLDEDG